MKKIYSNNSKRWKSFILFSALLSNQIFFFFLLIWISSSTIAVLVVFIESYWLSGVYLMYQKTSSIPVFCKNVCKHTADVENAYIIPYTEQNKSVLLIFLFFCLKIFLSMKNAFVWFSSRCRPEGRLNSVVGHTQSVFTMNQQVFFHLCLHKFLDKFGERSVETFDR